MIHLGANCKVYPTAKIADVCEVEMGDKSFIGDFVLVAVGKLVMGRGCQINAFTSITGGGYTVAIGENSVVSYGVRIMTRSDNPRGIHMNDASPESERAIRAGDVTIGDRCFIGANSVLMPNATIGNDSVIGAGGYVDKAIPEGVVVRPSIQWVQKPRKNYQNND